MLRAKTPLTDMDGVGTDATPDDFMLILGSVLQRLTLPFCRDLDSPKLMKIDQTYCAAPVPQSEEEQLACWQHLTWLDQETCLCIKFV